MTPFVWALLLALASPGPSLSLSEALGRARASAGELEAEVLLSAARLGRAESAQGWLDRPSLEAQAGLRRLGGASFGDFALELEVPLLASDKTSSGSSGGPEAWAGALRSAARAEKRRALAGAYAAAWEAQETALLARDDEATVERWLGRARQRVTAGAGAPFEADLLALELEAARWARADAESQAAERWTRLGALAELPAAPLALALPPLASLPPVEGLRSQFEAGAAARATRARGALAEQARQLEVRRSRSRWSLHPVLAREGEESVGRLGVRLGLMRRDEESSSAQAAGALAASLSRQSELELAALRARLEAALARAAAPAEGESEPAPVLAALELRLVEGKSSAAEVLPLRRAVLAALRARVERRAAIWQARFEIEELTAEVAP